MCLLRFIRVVWLILATMLVVSCAIHNEQTKVRNICLKGSECKTVPNNSFDRSGLNNVYSFFQNDGLSFMTMEMDLQDITMHNIHCKKCRIRNDSKNNQQIVNMYLNGVFKKNNGLPLNNVELNAVLRAYNGVQVNGFCNHTIGVVNPMEKFLKKKKFVIKDSTARYEKVVM